MGGEHGEGGMRRGIQGGGQGGQREGDKGKGT